ncbi:MAG: ATP-binding protein [Candidatus Omnitrophota bacterium]
MILLIIISATSACVIFVLLVNQYWKRQIKKNKQEFASGIKAALSFQGKLVKHGEAQLIQMEKMASLGILAAGIAHEINNPLGFLISNLETLQSYTKDLEKLIENKPLTDDLKAISVESLEGAKRIKKIVYDLRTFSRKSELQAAQVDINQTLESTLAIIWNEVKYKVDLVKDYHANTKIWADPTELSQVFLNILLNATQAIKDKGTVKLSTWEDEKNLFVKFSDNGCGIPEEALSNIFDPFFTTKTKGTGLGLSVSYNIIKKYNGEINAESKVGEGTTFLIKLPKIEGGEIKR